MRKLSMIIAGIAGSAILAQAITVTDSNSLNTLNASIVSAAKKNYGFMTGSGNVHPANTTEFFGLKFGIGVGIAGNPGFLGALNNPAQIANIETLISYVPAVYDVAFIKIGLPGFIPFLDKSDIGIRVGYIPAMGFVIKDGFSTKVDSSLAFGAELRKTVFELPAGLFRIDLRGSYSFNSGGIALQYATNVSGLDTVFNQSLTWTGSTIAVKAVAGINIPLLLSAFVGIGPDINFGGINSRSYVLAETNFTINGTTFSNGMSLNSLVTGNYDPFDIRVMAGARLFIVDAAVEYGILSGGLSLYAGVSFTF